MLNLAFMDMYCKGCKAYMTTIKHEHFKQIKEELDVSSGNLTKIIDYSRSHIHNTAWIEREHIEQIVILYSRALNGINRMQVCDLMELLEKIFWIWKWIIKEVPMEEQIENLLE